MYLAGVTAAPVYHSGGLAAVVAAVIIGIPSLWIRGVYFAVLTLILTFLVQRLAFSVPITRGRWASS